MESVSGDGVAEPAALFPGNIGEWLHDILDSHPQPLAGVPYTHTFSLPPNEYAEDGEPLPPRVQPTMTVTRIVQDEAPARACDTAGRPLLYGPDLHPLLLGHGIDRALS